MPISLPKLTKQKSVENLVLQCCPPLLGNIIQYMKDWNHFIFAEIFPKQYKQKHLSDSREKFAYQEAPTTDNQWKSSCGVPQIFTDYNNSCSRKTWVILNIRLSSETEPVFYLLVSLLQSFVVFSECSVFVLEILKFLLQLKFFEHKPKPKQTVDIIFSNSVR